MRILWFHSILILILIIGACASPLNPPAVPDTSSLASDDSDQSILFSTEMNSTGHYIMGMWELVFDFENVTAEAIPLRFAEGHFNVRKFMEEGPCYHCLTLLNFNPQPDDTLTVDVQFEHPFPGLDNFTGFDVRGIAIFNGSYTFGASGLVMSDHALGNLELLNADGYTSLFNPVDFPEGSSLPILTYSKGKFTSPLDSPATLNGFKAFFPNEPRRMFAAGESNTQNYHIARPDGMPLRVGYVVDASWDIPLSKPVTDPLTQFGPNANSIEAYKIEASIGSGLMPGCGFAPYQVDVYDHQGHDTIDMITIESPDLMSEILTDSSGIDMGDYTRFTGHIPNELEIGEGDYRVLIGAVDKTADPFLGTMTAYTITYATVEFVPIEYDQYWRKHGKTLDNHNHNPYETEIGTSLSEVWTHELPTGFFGWVYDCTPTIGATAVYVVSSSNTDIQGKIHALDLNTGLEIWSEVIKLQGDNAIYRSTPLIGNCEVYVGGSTVFCFDSEDGDQLWTVQPGEHQYLNGGPVVVDDILVIWGSNNTLFAYDPYTGVSLWDYTVEEFPGNPSTPVVDNGVVYAGDMLGNAFALDLETGTEIWLVQFPSDGPISNKGIWCAPVLADGLIWFGSFNCNLYGLDPTDGSIEVTVPLGDQIPWASAAFDGTYLYQPTALDWNYSQLFEGPFKVMAIATDGTVAWEFPGTDFEAFWTIPVVANNIVYVPSDAGVIYMLDPATGTELAPAYALDDSVTGGMSIQDGRLYITDCGGKVYCLE